MNKLIAVDIETHDPNLKTDGDGSCRTTGTEDDDGSYLLVVGTYDGEHAKAYYPYSENWNEFLELMKDDSIDKVLHNGIYDLAWLVCGYDVEFKGLLHDTMTRMVYIDEYADLDLDSCCKYFHVAGKNKQDTIEKWYADNLDSLRMIDSSIKKNDSLWKHTDFLWQNYNVFREQMVKYNLQDCIATWNLYQAQEPLMKAVYDAYMVDVKLTPLVIQMKKKGVLIDRKKLAELTTTIQADVDSKEKTLIDMYGINIETIKSSKKLGERLNAMGIHSPVTTKTGAESWGADAMARLMHYPVIPLITEIKGYQKLLDTYMHGGMANAIMSDNRIHCTFSPNKREDGGTVTGRFACLATGTMVFTVEHGYVPIERVQAGYHTISHTGKIVRIKQCICNGIKPVYLYEDLICTKDHLIWTGTTFKEAKDVSFKNIPKERGFMQADLRRVLESCKTEHSRLGYQVQDYCSQYTRSIEDVYNTRTNALTAWAKSEQSNEYRVKCYAWKMWKVASQLQRCNIQWSRQRNDKTQWPLCSLLSQSNGRRNRYRCRFVTKKFRSTPYKRRPFRQQTRQFNSMYRSRAWRDAQEIYRSPEGLFMGHVLVWDLEIEHKDHSFLANGYFVHNCSKPNLQQIPARDKQVGHSYGQAMRSLFLPEEGCMISALDYSQIEYLLLAHFAQGPQAEWFREQARAGVDFHTAAMQATGIPSRQVVKTFNYGVIYGMGWYTAMMKNYVLFEKAAEEHNETIEEYTQNVYNNYHAKLPVIRDTMKVVQQISKMQGYIMTIGGRYQHKPKLTFDPETGKMQDYIYKMLNKLIQGSAADILKFALLEAYESGIFDVLTMHLTVHDENVVSVPYNKIGTEANGELKHIMDMSFHSKLKVPMKAACELGPNWGYWDHDIWDDMQKGIFNRQKECWWYKE